MFKVSIVTPTTGLPRMLYTYSLAHLIMHFANYAVFAGDESQDMEYRVLEGSGISSGRETLARDIIKGDSTHVLFIDEDMGFAPDTLHMLASHDLPIVGCNYPMRVPGNHFTAVSEDRTYRVKTTAESTGLEPVWYMGFGFCLIKTEVFKAFAEDEPMFQLGYMPSEKRYATEDSYFFGECAKKGFRAFIDHDASKKIVHQGFFTYSWADEWSKPKTEADLSTTPAPIQP